MPVRTLVEIGNENYFNGKKFQIICPVEENRKIHIGDSNLFANNVLFRGRNDHAVFDLKSLNRHNEDTDLIFGNKNWVCENVLFLPRSNVLNGCVISERTLINKAFSEEHVLIAGIPGTVKKRNIMWSLHTEKVDFSEETPL